MLPLKFNLPPSEICTICLLIYHMVTENSIFKWQLITKIKFSDKANIQTFKLRRLQLAHMQILVYKFKSNFNLRIYVYS